MPIDITKVLTPDELFSCFPQCLQDSLIGDRLIPEGDYLTTRWHFKCPVHDFAIYYCEDRPTAVRDGNFFIEKWTARCQQCNQRQMDVGNTDNNR